MSSEQDLIKKLMVSKQIMDKHNNMSRRNSNELPTSLQTPELKEFQPVNATYNLPEEFISESTQGQYRVETPTEDRIKNSRLPEEIKRLMLEHPIEKPNMGVQTNVSLSNELVEKASRLMTNNKQTQVQQPQNTQKDLGSIRDIVRETVEDVLRENGLLVESESKSNEVFKFRVGQHIFEGKVTKIRKVTN
jgi:hypothetical protein